MVKILSLLSLLLAMQFAFAQNPILVQSTGGPPTGSAGSVIYQDASGNIGIGNTTTPSNVELDGTFTLVDGTQGAGKLLTSDNSGTASWKTPPQNWWGLTGNTGTSVSGNFLGTTDNAAFSIKTNSTQAVFIDGSTQQVGIGTNTPVAILDVARSNVINSSSTGVPASVLSARYAAVVDEGSMNYFTCSKVEVTGLFSSVGNTDFEIGPLGKVTIGEARAPADASNPADLFIKNHITLSSTDDFFANPFYYVSDADNNFLRAGLNISTSSHSSGAEVIVSNSEYAAPGLAFNPALAIFDNSNPFAPLPFVVSGQGTMAINVSSPLAQVDIGKKASVFSGTGVVSLDYLFHVGDESSTNSDFFAVDQWGLVGIGQLNHSSALVEISDM
ncbi:MAG: hypothetical protein JWO06_2551, partial [Bacteroidota bacterium]|nr:hypothetical protein [Bacteroidota bacterium]